VRYVPRRVSDAQSQAGPSLVVYRGSVNAWECDENDHLNVRFFGQRAWQGLAGVAAAVAIPGAFRANAGSTLLPTGAHIRFLKEARNHDSLTVQAGVAAIEPCAATVYQEIVDAEGAPYAAITTRVEHIGVREEAAFPWSQRTRTALERLMCRIPRHGAPRSIDAARRPCEATLARADALGAWRTGVGAIGAEECDMFGRMRPEFFLGRVSDSVPNLAPYWPPPADGDHVGGAVLEYRLAIRAWPHIGDLFEIRSAIAGFSDKTCRMIHWMLDPEAGGAWATAETVAVSFDRRTRKSLLIPEAHRATLEAVAIADMTL
jgi:acyl-CoA thioester hydrolase